jgi:hypothetical protein
MNDWKTQVVLTINSILYGFVRIRQSLIVVSCQLSVGGWNLAATDTLLRAGNTSGRSEQAGKGRGLVASIHASAPLATDNRQLTTVRVERPTDDCSALDPQLLSTIMVNILIMLNRWKQWYLLK